MEKKYKMFKDLEVYTHSMLAAMEARDMECATHCRRVGQLTLDFCRRIHLCKVEANTIAIAAAMHDVGKIAMPDDVLFSAIRLTNEEYSKMKTHAEIGAAMLSKAGCPENVVECVRHHHERWDGGGYPSGMSGTQIPLGARIIAICDTADVICHDRRYHSGESTDVCVSELRRCAGGQLDPVMISRFLHTEISLSNTEHRTQRTKLVADTAQLISKE